MSTTEERYPEHTKLGEISDESQAIGDFLSAAMDEDIFLCAYDDVSGRWLPVQKTIEMLLAEHFDIDPAKIEAEKRAMLDDILGGADPACEA